MFHSVRTRLTLWYAAVLVLSLLVFAFLVYYSVAQIFYARRDESLRSTARTVASFYTEELEEEHSATKANEVLLAEIVFPDRYVEITDREGHAVAWTRNLPPDGLAVPPQMLSDAQGDGVSVVTLDDLRIAIVSLAANQDLGFAAVAEPVNVVEEELRRLRRDFYAGVPLILLLTSAGGYFLARKSLAPIALMNRQTRLISAEHLSARLDVKNTRDELGELATTINDLLARLETSFKQQQRFVADASHELRTPLAVLRGEVEVALGQERDVDEYKESLALIKDEAERLSRIVEDLFVLAHQPIETSAKIRSEPVSLNQVASDCVRAAQVLAARKNLQLNFADDSTLLTTQGDEELLRRMVINLLDNAVKYTPAGGEITLQLQSQNGNARIVVTDTGIGIPVADQSLIFDRFYRVDKARSRAAGGAGLGLSIAGWIAEAHAGQIHVASDVGRGSVFTVELPLKPGGP